MNLDQAQRQHVIGWIRDGAKLSEIQNRLLSEFGLKLTYMEVRFLVDDLKVMPKDPEPPAKPVEPAATPAPAVPAPATTQSTGGVAVTVDQVTRPGALVSGKVTFSDGQSGEWYLDQMGRLGVAPKQAGYKPSAADVRQFQAALEKEITRLGL